MSEATSGSEASRDILYLVIAPRFVLVSFGFVSCFDIRISYLYSRRYALSMSLCLSALSKDGCIFISRNSLMAKSRLQTLPLVWDYFLVSDPGPGGGIPIC